MSEEKKKRTLSDVNAEYSEAVAHLGMAVFDFECRLPEKIDNLKQVIKRLHKEATYFPRQKVEAQDEQRVGAASDLRDTSEKLPEGDQENTRSSAI
jgi:23S rRNA maturation mini-RNase III